MKYLRDNYDDISREDYIYARTMVQAMNQTVSLYRDHRHRFFNYREFLRFVRAYGSATEEISKIPRTKNEDLRRIERDFNRVIVGGFFAYTPFLRSEIAGRVVLAVFAFLARLGVKAVGRQLDATQRIVAHAREQAAELAQPELQAA
jgi:hypothetical protein